MSDPTTQYPYLVPTTLSSLISGEDQVNNWMATANGANQYYPFRALTVNATNGPDATTFGTLNGSNGLILGNVGAAGDYLDKMVLSVSTAAQSR